MKSLWGVPFYRYLPAAILLVAAIVYFVTSLGYNPDARLFPLLIGATLLALLPLDLVAISRTSIGDKIRVWFNPADATPDEKDEEEERPLKRHVQALLFVFLLIALMYLCGILAAIPIYVASSVRFLGGRSWPIALIMAVSVGLSCYVLFTVALQTDLYPGILFN